jgi:hypothetical protein
MKACEAQSTLLEVHFEAQPMRESDRGLFDE